MFFDGVEAPIAPSQAEGLTSPLREVEIFDFGRGISGGGIPFPANIDGYASP